MSHDAPARPNAVKEMAGKTCGPWKVLRRAGPVAGSAARGRSKGAGWLCRCLCGRERVFPGNHLRKEYAPSCVCQRPSDAPKPDTGETP